MVEALNVPVIFHPPFFGNALQHEFLALIQEYRSQLEGQVGGENPGTFARWTGLPEQHLETEQDWS